MNDQICTESNLSGLSGKLNYEKDLFCIQRERSNAVNMTRLNVLMLNYSYFLWKCLYIDGFVQDFCNSCALAMELLQVCTHSSIYTTKVSIRIVTITHIHSITYYGMKDFKWQNFDHILRSMAMTTAISWLARTLALDNTEFIQNKFRSYCQRCLVWYAYGSTALGIAILKYLSCCNACCYSRKDDIVGITWFWIRQISHLVIVWGKDMLQSKTVGVPGARAQPFMNWLALKISSCACVFSTKLICVFSGTGVICYSVCDHIMKS